MHDGSLHALPCLRGMQTPSPPLGSPAFFIFVQLEVRIRGLINDLMYSSMESIPNDLTDLTAEMPSAIPLPGTGLVAPDYFNRLKAAWLRRHLRFPSASRR